MELSAHLPKIQFPKASMPSIHYVRKVWWDSSLQQQLRMPKISKSCFPASFLYLMTDWHRLQTSLPVLSGIIPLHHISSLTGFETLSLWVLSHLQSSLIIVFNKLLVNSLCKIFSTLHMQSTFICKNLVLGFPACGLQNTFKGYYYMITKKLMRKAHQLSIVLSGAWCALETI